MNDLTVSGCPGGGGGGQGQHIGAGVVCITDICHGYMSTPQCPEHLDLSTPS